MELFPGQVWRNCQTFPLFRSTSEVHGGFDGSAEEKTFNATISVKGTRTEYPKNYGHIIVDVVDGISKFRKIPRSYYILLLDGQKSSQFPRHFTFAIEHPYSAVAQQFVTIRQASAGTPMRALIMWELVGQAKSRFAANYGNVNSLCRGVSVYHLTKGEKTVEREAKGMQLDLNVSEYRSVGDRGGLHMHIFRQFDLLLVFTKEQKGRHASVQRAVNSLASTVPVLVEAVGETFKSFVAEYSYTCVFRNRVELEALLVKAKQTEFRRSCVAQGLKILADFSPSAIVQQYEDMFLEIEARSKRTP